MKLDQATIDKIREEGLESFGIFYGVYRGTVISNEDPENLGRLQINCEPLYDTETPNIWAWPMGNIAGIGHGIWWIPQPGDPVYISCEGGNPRFPLWQYGWWTRDAKTKNNNTPTSETRQFTFISPDGHRIDFHDKENYIDVKHNSGFHVKLVNDGIYLGKSDLNLGKFLDDLLKLLVETTTPTIYGASPFNNLAEYVELKTKIVQFLKLTE